MNLSVKEIVNKWTFRWDLMEVLIGGKSPIDLKSLGVEDKAAAKEFISSYGYDVDSAEDRKFIHATIVESLVFIEKTLMPREWKAGIRPPEEILRCDDILKFLNWASLGREDGKNGELAKWSCAILRVAHTIAHIQGVQRHADFQEAMEQIIGKFRDSIFRAPSGELRFGNETESVGIDSVEWKSTKARSSIILKLLHKPANVAETIYDFIGVRVITKNFADIMQAVKIMGSQFLISFPNANPKRARNSLVDIELFSEALKKEIVLVEKGELTEKELIQKINGMSNVEMKRSTDNPHSGSTYKSIQMTCRHLIRYSNPSLKWADKVEKHIKENGEIAGRKLALELMEYAKNWMDFLGEGHNKKVFFPFEVQVFDRQTKDNIERSDASHEKYKKAQVRTARKRVLFDVLNYYKSLK